MSRKFFTEVHCQQRNHQGERICGDVFRSTLVREEDRIIAVLSDGMGHGIKANILATLTATMALNFTKEHKQVDRIAEIVMRTLPVCSDRKISYATFSIIDIEADGKLNLLEYDNPRAIILRENLPMEMDWQEIKLNDPKNEGKKLYACSFYPQKEDRILIMSDGVAQSGMGSDTYPLGWERDRVEEYASRLVKNNPAISARALAGKIVTMAHKNDNYAAKDDTSCGAFYFREPRRLLLCSGPPYEREKDKTLAEKILHFDGKIIVSGGTTADIVSRELNRDITDSIDLIDADLPPLSYMEGIDLITEGILSLQKVHEILKDYREDLRLTKGPADSIVRLFLESDQVHFVIGTRINEAHQDPNLPIELEMRRTVIKRIARLLEDRFLKEVSLEYI